MSRSDTWRSCTLGAEGVCEGKLWTCRKCRAKFCQTHWHETSKGKNVECNTCEAERKEREGAKARREAKAKGKRLKTWPEVVTHEGRTYHRTGKTGRHEKTGLPSAEYESATASRVWLLEDGTIEDESGRWLRQDGAIEADPPEGFRYVTAWVRLVVRGGEPATLAEAARIVAGDSERGVGTYDMESVPITEEAARTFAGQHDATFFSMTPQKTRS